ncbi:MAG: DUF2442 domain-containing protein [Acidobacteriota bacterium]
MSTLGINLKDATAQGVTLTDGTLAVELTDGRSFTVPISWFPRLTHGTPTERGNWRLIGNGEGIHWADLDEDISVASLIEGRRSGETQDSLRR